MALDLSPGRLAAEGIMDATCTITRPGPASSGLVDEVTLQRISQPADSTTVYTGACFVSGVQSAQVEGTDVQQQSLRHQVRIPVSAPEIERNDIVTVTDGGNDPMLTGQVFRVLEPSPVGSVVVWRSVPCERIA